MLSTTANTLGLPVTPGSSTRDFSLSAYLPSSSFLLITCISIGLGSVEVLVSVYIERATPYFYYIFMHQE